MQQELPDRRSREERRSHHRRNNAGQFDSNLNPATQSAKAAYPVNITLPLINGTLKPKTQWCITNNPGEDTVTFTGANCGAASELKLAFNFTTSPGNVECKFKRAAAINGTFNTETSCHTAATFSPSGTPTFVADEVNPESCPKEGVLKTLKFRLFTDIAAGTGTNEWDDAESTKQPIWISAEL